MSDAMQQYTFEKSSAFKGIRTSARRLAILHNVDHMALLNRINKKTRLDAQVGQKPLLSLLEEQELVECLKLLAEGGFGMTNSGLIKFVNEYLATKNMQATGPSDSWITVFLKRYKSQLSQRKAKTIHTSRVKASSKLIIDDYFSLLAANFQNIDPTILQHVLWNADEAGFAPVLTHKNVIAARGSRNVQSITFNNSHQYTTVHVCANANGHIMKPFVLFKKTIPDESTLWNGAVYRSSFSGWMMTHNFLDWMQNVFYPTAFEVSHRYVPDYTGPIYLIVDGHSSHTNVEVVLMARNINITMIKLPAHSTHILQPLDVGFFAPVKKLWYNAIDDYTKTHNRTVDFSLILQILWSKVKPEYVINGFNKSGLYPLNINAINESDLKMAIPWTDEGYQARFGNEINQLLDNEENFVSHCLRTMQKVMSPPVTTQIRRVITQEERIQRGSGFGETLTLRPALNNIDVNVSPLKTKLCQVCQLTGNKNCIWVECLTCENQIHKKCWNTFKNKNQNQIRKSLWICPFCSMAVQNVI